MDGNSMAHLLDIFGNYCKNGSWHANSRDIRTDMYQRYEAMLSPARCREIWERAGNTGDSAASEERDQRASVEYANLIIDFQSYIDSQYDLINSAFGSNSQGFATFLGNLVEQYSVILAANTTFWTSQTLTMEKPGSTGGMLTGFLVRAGAEIYKEGPSTVQVEPVHDREDVILGRELEFSIRLANQTNGHIGRFLAPLIVVSCKVYLDLTRLENVRAKAESAKRLFPRSLFLVAAQTNALGGTRFCLDVATPIPAAISPVDDVFFLRGCRRQDYDGSRLTHPMKAEPMLDYARRVRLFLAAL
jgi:hypothetical protein